MKQLLAQFGQTPTKEIEATPPQLYTGRLLDLIDSIITTVLLVIGIAVLVYLIYGGTIYITAGGDAEKAGKGRTAITNAIIGLVIVIAALAIYKFVVDKVWGF